MPGTAFLPVAGPLGTLIGLGIGAAVMFIVGRNYHYLIQNFPEAGGAYGYVKRVCGGDHGFICGWFLILTYVAIAWANATAIALIGRHLLGGMFSFGFRYHVAGHDVYFGEVLLSAAALLLVGGVFLCGKRIAARLQTAFAFVLCAGIAVCVAAALANHQGGVAGFAPAFADGKPPVLQILAVVALAPWAFVGFESVSHSAEEFAFPRWRCA
jgi:amino acid transporter